MQENPDSQASALPKPQTPAPLNGAVLATLEQGRVPPQNIEIEEVVLGAMLVDKKGVDDAIDILSAEVFYNPANQLIFEAIYELFQQTKPVDLFTVTEVLKQKGNLQKVGGDFYLIQLTQKVSSAAHIDFYARILLQKYIQRNLIKISNEIIEQSYDNSIDVFDLLDNAEAKLFEVTQGNIQRSSESAKELVIKARKNIEEISKKGNEFSGVPTGFVKLDQLTAGWQPSDFIVVAARPAMGKTGFTLSMARNMAVNYNIPVAFFSLEMSSVQLITRLISSEANISSETLRTGKLSPEEWQRLNENLGALENAPLYIDDTPSISIFDLRAKARRMVSRYGIRIIIIDYLQLMTGTTGKGSGNREQEISTISRNLKVLAKELSIPIIALSQLSRNVEQRAGKHKRPQLSDLRESGAIEQDADIVTFLYRPEYYEIYQWDEGDGEFDSTKDQAEIIVAKHRNGGLDRIRMKYQKGSFYNLDMFEGEMIMSESKINSTDPLPVTTTFSPRDAFMMDNPDDEDDGDIPY